MENPQLESNAIAAGGARLRRRVGRFLSFCALAAASSVAGWSDWGRTAEIWRDASGQFQVEADFLGIRGVDVYLKKPNGVTVKVPLTRLNAESQQLARQMAAAPTSAPGAAEAPDVAMRNLMQQLESGNPRAVWDALPGRYQSDVNDVIHTFAENMDAPIWDSGVSVLQKAVRVFKEKKAFIQGHPAVQKGLADKPVDPATMNANWDGAVGLMETILASDVTSLEKLKTIDVAQYLDGTGRAVMEKLTAIAASIDQSGLKLEEFPGVPVTAMPVTDLSKVQISAVRVEGDSATLKIVKADGQEDQKEFVRLDGKWLPQEMVEGWDGWMAQARQSLTTEMTQQMQTKKQQLVMPMMMANGVLDQLLAAQTQEQFNQVIEGVTGLFAPAAGAPGAGGAGAGNAGGNPFGG